MGGFDAAFQKVASLVEAFESNLNHYKSPKYTEAQARKDFIDKFWMALGWDVNHDVQTNPYEQEVKVERSVTTEGKQRRADYAFYLAPNYHDVKFLVEAKKPSVDIATPESCFQLIRYAWNSDTPLAVLTDFEQLLVLDCRYKPDIGSATNQVLQKYYYTEYTDKEKFAKIYWLFSHEAVEQGSIEKRAAELPKPRGKAVQRGLFSGGYQSIDSSFLAELDEHRMSLAKNFKNNNPELESETLTELAQRTLDRLVFLRFLEDKGIEPARLVENFGTKGSAWHDFIAASRRLDGIYNGIVYKHHDILDGKDFRVDDKAFSQIRDSLAHANSPYDFNSIPIHILGSIYERFLGKVIVATDKRARVEEKPEVRKAGGVYYTPSYIVRYIVANTVGKLIEGKTPSEIAAMRFADIACGSGSFLLGVYDLLLSYHGHYYNDNPAKAREADCVERGGKLYLTLAKKREILLNNIYGVDIDPQAVEVCQLSLYLKLLQDETEASAHQYLLDFARDARLKKLLPDLSRNIRCGNSLIGPDFYNEQGNLFDTKESRRINAFDWTSKEHGFGEIMVQGGFDAVIGNPPYVRIINLTKEKNYYKTNFDSATGAYDIYILFMEKALALVRQNGLVGFITPNKYFVADYGREIRNKLLNKTALIEIADLGKCKSVFYGALISTAITFYKKSQPVKHLALKILSDDNVTRIAEEKPTEVNLQEITTDDGLIRVYQDTKTSPILIKLSLHSAPLASVAKVRTGVMGFDYWAMDKYISDSKSGIRIATNSYLDRYTFLWGKKVNLYKRELYNPRLSPKCDVLNENTLKLFKSKKIVVRGVAKRLTAMLDTEGVGMLVAVHSVKSDIYDNRFILGLLNSTLINWVHLIQFYSARIPEGSLRYPISFLSNLPIHTIDFNNKDDKAMHDRMVELVEVMLKLNKELHEQKLSERDREALKRRIDYTDREIDKLVYKLYGLTDDEIRIVEG